MTSIIVVAIILVAVVFYTIFSKIQAKKALAARLELAFGKPPEEKDTEFESIRRYVSRCAKSDLFVDHITWNDLDMDRVFERVNACQSSVGEEYLYSVLHQPQFDEDALQKREALIQFFDQNPAERLAAQVALAGVGKRNYNGISHLIFGDMQRLPRAWVYKVLAALPVVGLLGFFLHLGVGIIGVFLAFAVNGIVYHQVTKKIGAEFPAIGYFSRMMKCAKKLPDTKGLQDQPTIKHMQSLRRVFKKVVSKAPTQTSGFTGNIVEDMWLYGTILFLYDIRHYNNFMAAIIQNRDTFHELYKAIGEVDTALAVLSFRKSLPAYSLPAFHSQNTLDFEGVFHPLITQPVTNTGALAKDVLITGSNASGKSTFIKTLAVNGILAQTIYTCAAGRFATRFNMVVTSMALRDNLQEKESYFVVEVKSLKRILDMVKKHPCACYIDEILRGTNTAERIAASSAVLEYLHGQDCLCVAASHDIELTRILAGQYHNYNFCETVTDREVLFDYKLKEGPSTTRTAIKLLDVMGFDEEIIESANRRVK
ncbi:MAG: hypothetical protein FWG38_02110 [Defluviitaleaceae bacterium]|nr:hypothetical protein [Defluviitaleaceae bacterium]